MKVKNKILSIKVAKCNIKDDGQCMKKVKNTCYIKDCHAEEG
jgi:hypothetical protein